MKSRPDPRTEPPAETWMPLPTTTAKSLPPVARRLLAVIPSADRVHARRAGYDAALGDLSVAEAVTDLERRGLVQRQGNDPSILALTVAGRNWRRLA